jgi:hypothetical protein
MWYYRDTISLDPDEPSAAIGIVDDTIRQFGFLHGHKSSDSVEFQVEAPSQWELRDKMGELLDSLGTLTTGYSLKKECVYWAFDDDN